MLQLNLFGMPEIYLDTPPNLRFRTRKAQALLIYLAVTEQRWTRDALAALFWPESNDTQARKNLRDILPTLRRQVGEYLSFEDETIEINPSSKFNCDVREFNAVMEKSLQAVETSLLVKSLALYRGEFLEGYRTSKISVDFERWALRERDRLQQLARTGLTTLCQRQQEAGAYEDALTTNQQLLKLAPWDEAAHRQQMLLLAQSGQQAAAMVHFETCCQILADELDVAPDAETVKLYEQIKSEQAFTNRTDGTKLDLSQPSQAAQGPHNLPRQLTSLIGRDSDVEALQRLLFDENVALLTLVGQGGVGKTRLALAIAQKLRRSAHQQYPDGIWFVPLTSIAGGEDAKEQIASAIAQAMQLSLTGSDLLSKQIIRALQEQQLLLILDNFEHLREDASFLLELVQTAQQVKVLITSRQQLQLYVEYLYPVNGLPTPPLVDLVNELADAHHLARSQLHHESEPQPLPTEDLSRYPSVELFVERIQQRLPDFQLTTHNQENIGRICQLLGGVPLGIELAAQLYVEQGAIVLEQLIAEIQQADPLNTAESAAPVGLDHLQSSAIDMPERQRSIRAVFAYSWQLLNVTEQDLLCHCAIFRGGFTREAILAIADGNGNGSGSGNGATLLALVMKSLLKRDSHDRYDMHELVRQYVIAQFQQKPTNIDVAAQKHAGYFMNLLVGQEEALFQQAEFHQTIRTEINNIRAAWQWLTQQAASDKENVRLLDGSVTCLFEFFFFAEQYQDAFALALQSILPVRELAAKEEQPSTATKLLGHLLNYAAKAGLHTGQVTMAKGWLQESKQIGEELDDAALMTRVHLTLLLTEIVASDFAGEMIQAALAWGKRAEVPFLQVVVLLEAVEYWCWSSPDAAPKASTHWKAAMDLIRANRYEYIAGYAYIVRNMIYEIEEEWEKTIQTLMQGLEYCQEHHSTFGTHEAHKALGFMHMYLGNFTEAHYWATLCYKRNKAAGNLFGIRADLLSLGYIDSVLQNWAVAESYLKESVAISETLDYAFGILIGHLFLGNMFSLQNRYAESLTCYQKALELTPTVNFPEYKAVIQSGVALALQQQGKKNQALVKIEPLIANDKLFTFRLFDAISIAARVYQVLAAHNDPRASNILERAYHLLQSQAEKITDDTLRTAFLENVPEHRAIVGFWKAQNGNAEKVGKKPKPQLFGQAHLERQQH